MSSPLTTPEPTFHFGGYLDDKPGPDGVGFWPRAGARIIDTILHTLVGIVAGLAFGIMLGIATALTGSDPAPLIQKAGTSPILAFLAGITGHVAYHTICEGLHGSTLGKMLLGQVVLTDDLQPCGPRSALIRSLAYYVDTLFFGAVGYLVMNKTRQMKRHGDNWADTFVTRRAEVSPDQLRSTGRFVAVLVLAMAMDAAIAMTALVAMIV